MRGEKLFLQCFKGRRNFSGWRVVAKIMQQCQYISCCGPQRVSCKTIKCFQIWSATSVD